MNKFKKICIILSILVIMVFTAGNIYAINSYKKLINKNEEKVHTYQKNIKTSSQSKNNDISNILLIGSDSGDFNEISRSDSMIILTIDDKNKILKLSSLARDTLVNIPGYGYEKLTHAYAYGKAELLLKTIKENFKIDIDDYIAVNFNSFIDLIDLIGGVEVNVDEKEISHLNDVIVNSFNLTQKEAEEPQFIRSDGKQLLNGYQALSYARIRKLDNIYERDKRQRDILKSIANKLVELPVSSYPKVIKEMSEYIDVNISMPRLIKLAVKLKDLYNYDLKQMEFPLKEYREPGKLAKDNSFVVKWNKAENLKNLNDFIYNE